MIRLTWVTRQTRQIFPSDRIREGWCKNCQTCKIANLQFRWVSQSVSQWVTIISARDAGASENTLYISVQCSGFPNHAFLNYLHLCDFTNFIQFIMFQNTCCHVWDRCCIEECFGQAKEATWTRFSHSKVYSKNFVAYQSEKAAESRRKSVQGSGICNPSRSGRLTKAKVLSGRNKFSQGFFVLVCGVTNIFHKTRCSREPLKLPWLSCHRKTLDQW